MNNTMSYIHFWVTFVGAYLIFWPMHYEGLAGLPRRYLDYSGWSSFNQFGGLNRFISTVAMVVFAVQLMFVFNFFYSIFKGRKVITKNPWQANTLEWTTPIRPGHGNWPGEIPEVHRWAYDYGKDGKELSFKLNHLEPMNSTISSGPKPFRLNSPESLHQSGSFKIADKLKDYMLLVKFNLSFMVVFSAVISYLLAPLVKYTTESNYAFIRWGYAGYRQR